MLRNAFKKTCCFLALLPFLLSISAAWSPPTTGYDPEAKVIGIFSAERVELSNRYNLHHYGIDSCYLRNPKIIVLHYTAFHTLQESLRFFKPAVLDPVLRSDIKAGGDVNVSTHYLVDRDGTLYQLASENLCCRHVIGFNYTAIAIENVGSDAKDLTEAQCRSNAALVTRIMARHPSIEYLIGHSEYRDSHLPHFKLFKENDPSYRLTDKTDPGAPFLACVRTLLKERYGIRLKD